MVRKHLLATTFMGGVALLNVGALAQQAPTPNTSAQINAAFQEVLRNPANLAAGQEYARLLVLDGNFEGGIAALERLLLDPAADPKVRVELAVLYYRIGSYAASESYLREALADSRLSGQVRKDTESLLRDLERRNAKGGRLSGNTSVGLRFQTNPTAAANGDTRLQNDSRVEIPAESRRRSDVDGFASANLRHEWDLETQNMASLVSTGSLFVNHYRRAAHYDSSSAKNDPQDFAAISATTGIQFQPAPVDAPALTLRPFVAGSEQLLNGRQYMGAVGGGLEGDLHLNGGATLVGATYDIRRTAFAERSDVSESRAQSGFEQFVQLRASQEVSSLQVVSADLTLRDHNAGRDYFAYLSAEGRVTYALRYDSPISGSENLWGNSLYAAAAQRTYGGADATVSASTTRDDVEWRLGATQLIPVADAVSVMMAIEYVIADSNLPNYTYNNFLGLSSVVWSF